MSDKSNPQELSFEERIAANFGADNAPPNSDVREKLREMNKKLPSWSLEPPLDFID